MKASTCTDCATADVVDQPADKTEQASKASGSISKFKAVCGFLRCGTCSKTLMNLIDRQYGQELKLEEQATDPLAGGMMQGYQCGMLWGSTLAAGAQAHRLHGAGPQAEAAAMRAAQKVVAAFRARHDHINCLEMTETDPKDKWGLFVHFFLKGGTVTCARRIANTAGEAFDEINSAMSEEQPAPSCNPANCASMLAKKMGASDMHATMAAGFAGGIGFSGGGCGALGAAIWIIGMKMREEGAKNKAINAKIEETIENFLKASDFEFECAEIVGRQFEDLADHAAHVHEGGCEEIIEVLAASLQTQPALEGQVAEATS